MLEKDPAATTGAASPAAAVAPPPPPNGPTSPPPAPTTPTVDPGGSSAWPLVLGGAGVVGLAVGTGFALKAKSTDAKSKQDCDKANPNSCGPNGLTLRNDALSQGNIATVAFIAGGAFIAAAGLVWILEPKPAAAAAATRPHPLRASAAIAPGNAALFVQGNF